MTKKGLKFGLYSDAGVKTCAGNPGSLNHEFEDFQQFKKWKIDYLKYDNCYPSNQEDIYKMDYSKSLLHMPVPFQNPDEKTRFSKMGKFVKNSGIIFELCTYGWGNVENWGNKIGGHIWRTSADIKDRWPSVLSNLDKNDEFRFLDSQGNSYLFT